MFIISLALAHVISAQRIDRMEIAVNHARPSRILKRVREIYSRGPIYWPFRGVNDGTGVIYAEGFKEELLEAKTRVATFDVVRRSVSLKVVVDSKVDKVLCEMSAKLLSEQAWMTADGETGVQLNLVPRVNDDGTITVSVTYQFETGEPIKIAFRVRNKETQDIGQAIAASQKEYPPLPQPKITIRAEVLDQ